MKYKVGLTSRIIHTKEYFEIRDCISQDMIKFVQKFDLIPIVIPNNHKLIEEYIKMVDFIILTGGNNIHNQIEPSNQEYSISKVRDEIENEVIRRCIENNIPILGVCRGMQLLNTYFGGEITKLENLADHNATKHNIYFKENIISNEKNKSIVVNSFHTFSIETLSSELVAWAHSEDGKIEGFKHESLPIYGIMWHPERKSYSDYSVNLSEKIINKLIDKK